MLFRTFTVPLVTICHSAIGSHSHYPKGATPTRPRPSPEPDTGTDLLPETVSTSQEVYMESCHLFLHLLLWWFEQV